jgi:hypothetical protein
MWGIPVATAYILYKERGLERESMAVLEWKKEQTGANDE